MIFSEHVKCRSHERFCVLGKKYGRERGFSFVKCSGLILRLA